MELIIILVVMVVVSVVVYFQMKGAKPELITISDLTTPYKKKEKKEPKVEKKVTSEQWDKAEVVKRDSSPGEKRRTRKRDMFDPVKEGLKVVAAPKIAAEDVANLTEKEEKSQKKRLEADGFVVVKEKKVVPKAPAAADAGEEEEDEVVDTSPNAQRLAMFKLIAQGGTTARRPAPNAAGGSSASFGSSSPKKPDQAKKDAIKYDDIAEKLNKQRQEAEEHKKKFSTSDKGGKVVARAAPVEIKPKAGLATNLRWVKPKPEKTDDEEAEEAKEEEPKEDADEEPAKEEADEDDEY